MKRAVIIARAHLGPCGLERAARPHGRGPDLHRGRGRVRVVGQQPAASGSTTPASPTAAGTGVKQR